MRTIYILLCLIVLCVWLGFELRQNYRDIAQVLWGVAVMLSLFLVAGMMGWY